MAIDNNVFYIQSKNLENFATEFALQQANKPELKSLPNWKKNQIFRQISKEAFELFKNKIIEQFSSNEYSNIITLTLQARTNYFFISLIEKMKEKN
jgi:hypothetical protein